MNEFTAPHPVFRCHLPCHVPVYSVSATFSDIQRPFRSSIGPCTQVVTFQEYTRPLLVFWSSLHLEAAMVPPWRLCLLQGFFSVWLNLESYLWTRKSFSSCWFWHALPPSCIDFGPPDVIPNAPSAPAHSDVRVPSVSFWCSSWANSAL